MITHDLEYPRIGNNREHKKAIEGYWSGSITYKQRILASATIKQNNWSLQKDMNKLIITKNE